MRFDDRIYKMFPMLVPFRDRWIENRMPVNPRYYGRFTFSGSKDFSMIMIGAHNGKKTKHFVRDASKHGKVCLIEPVPHLFQQLQMLHSSTDEMILVNKCITPVETDYVDFFAPNPDANKIRHFGDQLGSLNADHAKNHDPGFEGAIHKISVEARTMEQLLADLNCEDINLLFLDTEGFDAEILATFPFKKLKPHLILFEHKHSDGTHNIGEKFAKIIITLNEQGYQVQCIDRENCLATLR